jgi:predicted N-acetyltransferase YhbS
MGNNFPRITNLKESPQFIEETLKLIEKSFQYNGQNSFSQDFFPLVNQENHANCFILIDENNKVIAHVGAKDKILTLENKKFPLTLLGGIAVHESQRGQGNFANLFQDVLAEKRSDTSLFLLWSDQEKLYKKYGFYLCGEQFELPMTKLDSSLTKTKYSALSEDGKKDLQQLFESSFKKNFLTPERDWRDVEGTASADLFIRKSENKITDYFFMNKGQDLGGVIYEYGSSDLVSWLKVASQYGRVWMGSPLIETQMSQYQYFLCPGDLRLFTEFVLAHTKNQISIRNINLMKQEAYFDFNEELMGLDVEEFLRGIFGPGVFEELGNEMRPLFLSGLDSI